MFVFALGIAGSIYAYNARRTYAVEAFLLLQIAICIGAASVMENTGYSSRYMRRSKQSILLRTITINAGLAFDLCYWWRGLDIMRPTPCTDAESILASVHAQMERRGTYAFYFFRVSLYVWMRVVMKVGAIVALVNYVCNCTSRDIVEAIQGYRLSNARSNLVKLVASASISKSSGARVEEASMKPGVNYTVKATDDETLHNTSIEFLRILPI